MGEFVEQSFKRLGWYTRTGVYYREANHFSIAAIGVSFRSDTQCNGAFLSILKTITEEVGKDLTQFSFVRVHGAGDLILFDHKGVTSFLRQWRIDCCEHLHHVFDIEVGWEYFHLARFDLR